MSTDIKVLIALAIVMVLFAVAGYLRKTTSGKKAPLQLSLIALPTMAGTQGDRRERPLELVQTQQGMSKMKNNWTSSN